MVVEIAGWVRRLTYLVMALTFLDLLIPANQMKRVVKVVIGFFITAAIVMPVINWMRVQRSLDIHPFYQEVSNEELWSTWEVEERGNNQLENLYSSAMGLEAVRRLKSQGISAQVSVDWSVEGGINSVEVALLDGHNSDQVKEVLSTLLEVPSDQVRVEEY